MTLVNYTKKFGLFNSSEDGKVNRIGTVLGVGAGAVGLATGAIGLKKALSDDSKFTVVYLTANGAQKMIVKAADKITARNKVQSRVNGSEFKVFQVPMENDAALDYYEHLQSTQH